MNKYASGYTLIQILSVIGWLIIVISVIGGIFVASNADRGMGWVGISVAIAGSFQGLLLLGIGAIGTAILDGAVAQQETKNSLHTIATYLKPEEKNQDYQSGNELRQRNVDFSKVKPMRSVEELNKPSFKE